MFCWFELLKLSVVKITFFFLFFSTCVFDLGYLSDGFWNSDSWASGRVRVRPWR